MSVQSHLSFDVLTQAISPFSRDPLTVDQTFGYLLSFALADFTLSSTFKIFRKDPERDTAVSQLAHRFTEIRIPQAVLAMANLLSNIPQFDESLPYFVYKVIERLSSFNHRNQAFLSAMGLARLLFERLYIPEFRTHAIDQPTEAVMQKLLKKMLGVGASTMDVRLMFQKAVREDNSLDSHILEILRSSMRVKWPEHFSFDGAASIELKDENPKGMQCPYGFSFMVGVIFPIVILFPSYF